MDIVIAVVLVIVGIAIILYGADFLVEGAVALAYRYKISTAVVGLTIVAFGTSTPELAVSLTGAIQGQSDIALGNVIGSNTFNILAILGVCALMRPLLVRRSSLRYEMPLMIISSLLLCILSLDSLFDASLTDKLTRGDGLVLLFFFIIFMAYSFAIARQTEQKELAAEASLADNPKDHSEAPKGKKSKGYMAIIMMAGGLLMLVGGSRIFVRGATDIAQSLHISEAIIGVTLAAVGTSLPELITSAVSVRKGQIDIAVNNVVGSNIFNILFILGSTSVITPMGRGDITYVDYLFMLGSALALVIFSLFPKRGIITRFTGLFFLIAYIVYMGLLVESATSAI